MNEKRDAVIREIEPEFDDRGVINPKQKCCATCKYRLDCEKLYVQRQVNREMQTYEDLLVSMYYICDDYSPVFIEYPILVNGISSEQSFVNGEEANVGKFCLVSVNADGYDSDLHIGIFLGMLPWSIISLYDRKTTEIRNKFYNSPCAFVPKFNKLFYGQQMRWQFIESDDDIEAIHSEDPADYVLMARKNLK